MNTVEFLMVTSAVVPERTAIIFEGKRLSYADLQARSARLANALLGLGVAKGDRVALMEVNSYQAIEAYFACAKAGAIFVPLNFRARAEEISFMLNDSGAIVLLVGERYLDLIESVRKGTPDLTHQISLSSDTYGMLSYERLIAEAAGEEPSIELTDDDMTILMFTAGTTGRPKGVMLAHQNFSDYVLSNVSPVEPDVEEKNLLTVPLYHIAGIQGMLAAVYGGRTLVVQRQFEAEAWMKLVQHERIDRAMMVPTMLKQLLDHPKFKQYDLSSLKVITYGAAPMPLEVIKRALKELAGCRFINAFGQTESAATITMLGPDDHDISGTPEQVEQKLKRLSSIGKPLPDIEVRIMDEDGKLLGPDHVGEIVAKGGRVMKGYWKQEAATSSTIDAHGWLHTGDLGYQDQDGYIFLTGRAKDVIKRGGEMVSPEEVENAILSHPGVEDVAIIGVPDEEWGERVRAVVTPKAGHHLTESEIIEHCRTRLASFKKPESVVFVDEIPRNSMGKILKRELRQRYGQIIQP